MDLPEQPPTDLDFYMGLIRGWTRDLEGSPSWQAETFVHGLVLWPDRLISIPRSSTKTLDDFRQEFPALVTSGLSWVNLSTWGVLNQHLVIGIELPNYRSPAQVASVNWGGPPRFIQQRRGWNLDGLLEIAP